MQRVREEGGIEGKRGDGGMKGRMSEGMKKEARGERGRSMEGEESRGEADTIFRGVAMCPSNGETKKRQGVFSRFRGGRKGDKQKDKGFSADFWEGTNVFGPFFGGGQIFQKTVTT